MASTSAAPSPNLELTNNPSKTREEGELSSSGDDDFPTCSGTHNTSTAAPAAPDESFPAAAENKNTGSFKAGKYISTINHASSVDIHSKASVQPNHCKGFEKNRVPLKSGTPAWFVPSRVNSNLVISFSDDDSGSDSEECGQEKASETKGNARGVTSNRRPPIPTQGKMQMLCQATRNETKFMPKKASLNRTVISSMTKTPGTNSRNAGLASIEQGFRVRNLNTFNKNSAGREHGSNQNVVLNSSKLQDLRHQIAMRESELKLKSAQQNKEIVSSLCKDYDIISSNNDATRKTRLTSTEIELSEPKEPEKKRMKLNEPYSSSLLDVGRGIKEAITDNSHIKEPITENSHPQEKSMVDRSCCEKEIPTGTTMSSIVKWQKQDDKLVPDSTQSLQMGVKDGGDTTASCSQSEKRLRMPDPLLQNQTAPSANVTSKTCLGKSASQSAASFWNYLDEANIAGHSDVDVQSLVEIEEMQDKELEEAQEYRCRCEIEERNALKAYRKAQRALIEANARCTYLYRKRELYSAHFRSLIMEDSSLLWSSGKQNRIGIGLNSSNNASKVDADLVPMSNHQMQNGFDIYNRPMYHPNIQFAEGALLNMSDRNADGQNLGSEACSEPDASTSEILPEKVGLIANGVCSPSSDNNTVADEDEEMLSFGQKAAQPNLECNRKERIYEEREENMNDDSKRGLSVDSSQDSLLLEASLRSELFARLGKRTYSKNGSPAQGVEPIVERGAENDDESGKSQMSMSNVCFSKAEKNRQSDVGGKQSLSNDSGPARSADPIIERGAENDDGSEKSQMSLGNMPSQAEKNQRSDFGEESRCPIREAHDPGTSFCISPLPILMSPFAHLRVTSPVNFMGLHGRDKENRSYDNCSVGGISASSNKVQPGIMRPDYMLETLRDTCFGEVGSYTCNLTIDPIWPLCMYELRGKCNNEECSSQHFKDYSARNSNQHGDSNGAAWSLGHCWRKCFSTALAISNSLQRSLPSDNPFLLGNDSRIEVHASWNRQSLYFQSQNCEVDQLKQGLGDYDHTLEMVFFALNQESNPGVNKALDMLSRALEKDPTSVILWVVYLLIFYANKNSIEKDDMFFHAIKHNERSYELWLMYINSRVHLDERLVAYDTALSALCCHASASGSDVMHASACILDLFLQMIDCFCMSGNAEKAVQRICGLFLNTKNSDSSHSLLLSNLLPYLTLSDKCIFWVCCVYFVVYRRLPNEIVQQFEFGKELSAIEWLSARLMVNEKQQAIKLIEMAVDSIASYKDDESVRSETTFRSVHLFAVNHISCMVALNELECSQNLLDKYIMLYPSCLELVLISARAQKHDSGDLSFVGFEKALSNWPKEVPGIQCIWNQYVEYALQNGRSDFAKELMVRWFHSVWKIHCPENGILNAMDSDNGHNSCGLIESASASSPDILKSDFNQRDALFGLLNLSLCRILQNDHAEACIAIDRALKVAAPKDFKQCVREHAMFLLTVGPQSEEDASVNGILNILKGYLVNARASPESLPLSRKFIQDIKKPRIRQLMNSILCPISADFSLVNLVLEGWHGPSLLPHEFGKLKYLVDFVEAIMEILPSNYQLAISVCKLLLRRGVKSDKVNSASVLFWASSLLVNAISEAVPVAPEYIWVEAAGILGNLSGVRTICESFLKRALSVYPFSIGLWRSYLSFCRVTGSMSTVVGAARDKGIELE
ncbi:uncharacterized protein LOC131165553 isoform X2 [Malania oleifera]|uniref:uncharacterized protein LOC131165553 isoform X2 n=1 Tax=Malania oleifera TaxID=397392 RepID=UPI0025AE549B|nr:uncharacterized protein LOC131165553 isoform X2 [Malania oleifera]